MKRFLSLTLALVMILALAIPAMAYPDGATQLNQLKNGGPVSADTGANFDHMDCGYAVNVTGLDTATESYAFWHFVDTDKGVAEGGGIAYIKFTQQTEILEVYMNGTNDFCVITPADWTIEDAWTFNNGGKFNLSHSGTKIIEVMENEAYIQINKYIGEFGIAGEGFWFDIYAEDDTWVGEMVSDEMGEASVTIKPINPGSYYIRERNVPNEFIVPADLWFIVDEYDNVEYNDSINFIINEYKYGALEVDASATLKTNYEDYKEIFQREIWQYKYTTGSYGSVTATNVGVKNQIVPNANHFTYAKIAVADLEAGVSLDMVVGNKIDKVGNATVQLVDGKLVLTIDNMYKGEWGFGAYTNLPEPKNGNIHSGQGDKNFKHNNGLTANLPAADKNGFIYIYVHCDNIKFFKTTEEFDEEIVGEYKKVGEEIVDEYSITDDVDVTITVYDADGNVVTDLDKLLPGTYTIVYYDSYLDQEFTELVEIISGEVTTATGYSAEHEIEEVVRTNVGPDEFLDDIVNPIEYIVK